MKDLVIIGGGIAGLAAAWEAQGRGLDYVIVEAGDHWGGKIVTRELPAPKGNGRFVVDGGPESFVTRKPEVWDLAHELGLGDELVNPGSETRNIFVLDAGRPQPVPLTPKTFLTTPLLSAKGKLRMMAEPFVRPRRDDGDESLQSFVSRRLGVEAATKVMGPILAGIYNTDPQSQSVLVASPVMREMEAASGSLVKATVGKIFARRKQSGPKRPSFVTFAGGAGRLVDALVNQLTGQLILGVAAERVSASKGGYRVGFADGSELVGHRVLLATQANVAAHLLGEFGDVAGKLEEIRHTDIGTAMLVYQDADATASLGIQGVMVPRSERRRIDAITFPGRKSPERGVPGYTMVRVFFGASDPTMLTLSDDALITAVGGELRSMVGIEGVPVEYTIFRWPGQFGQADVGHLDRVDLIEDLLPPGIAVAGGAFRGVGVPDCIRQGRQGVQLLYPRGDLA